MLSCEQNHFKKYKILIIEDFEFVNNAVKTTLSIKKYCIVKQAFDFEQASQKVNNDEYDFIILDLNLSDVYGEELVNDIKSLSKAKIIILTAEADKQIREKNEFCHIPIIILSGNNDPELIRDCLKSGASNFITKPSEVLCKQKMLDEYKLAVDDSSSYY